MADPSDGGAGAGVGGLDVLLCPGPRVGSRFGLASVGGQPLVAQLAAGSDAEDVVGRAVDAEVGDGAVAARAAGEEGAGQDGHGLEDVYSFLGVSGC